ncbi:sensor histidine kinase [Anaerocolumna xylanovorans]|uniref:histidine kinase n=1 Tax=Anaerocolumna xylanovorans DSM 12503 TaxID=1121345 RepID=A0A1M7YHB9_9FIRM|nr:ATP-binding protein [Anaerocolumna xylanovorans]SHO52020.1 Signal transduction histidine kinase [Anaerocolumna xylanovorans DSM 12503]
MDRKQGKPFNRLFFKVYLNYALVLALFAILVGLIFMNLYENATMESYRDKMLKQAGVISKRLSRAITNNEADGYLDYLAIIQELDYDESDIWTISNPNAKSPMDKQFENVNLEDVKLPQDCVTVIEKAFEGKLLNKSGYYEEFGGTSAIQGYPVTVNGEVVGVVLLRTEIKKQEEIVSSSMYLIYFSVGIALFISFIIAIVFAKGITKPIISMRAAALLLADGQYESKLFLNRRDEIGDLATTIDILADRLKESEVERQSREQMRTDFFANVSHELRTPITVVRAYTEMLVDGIVTEEDKVNQYYAKILAECKGMERLVGDLLLLSKMQNPDFEVEKEPVNVVQIFEDLLRSFHPLCQDKEIQMVFTKEYPVYIMMGDYDRLKQMFLIILDNAVKFSKENSSIYINLTKTDKLLISVRDEGIGISKEELPYIFDKFYRSKLKQNEQGSGLGLAIARQIALKHDGDIVVKSEEGKWTEFLFSFQSLENFVEELDIS